MKKMACLLLAVCLILPAVAEAAPAPEEAAQRFVFRNGITFGMTPAEVEALEEARLAGADCVNGPHSQDGKSYLFVNEDNLVANTVYIFEEAEEGGRLIEIMYGVYDLVLAAQHSPDAGIPAADEAATQRDYLMIEESLASKYGDGEEMDTLLAQHPQTFEEIVSSARQIIRRTAADDKSIVVIEHWISSDTSGTINCVCYRAMTRADYQLEAFPQVTQNYLDNIL